MKRAFLVVLAELLELKLHCSLLLIPRRYVISTLTFTAG